MNPIRLTIPAGLLILLLSHWVPAQQTLVFSAVEETLTAKIAQRILKNAYQKIGITAEIQELPGTRGLIYSNGAITDGEAFRIAGMEQNFPNLCRIEVPICTHSLYLFVKKGREFNVNGWASIPKDYRIGHQSGIQIIEKNIQQHQIRAEPVRFSGQLFTMLEFGRVDAVIEGKYQRVLSAQELEAENMVRLEPALHSHPLYHYLHVKHAALIPQITAVLREMQRSGELLLIQEKVIAAQFQKKRGAASSGSGM